MKKYIPKVIIIKARVLLRTLKDMANFSYFNYARKRGKIENPFRIEISQKIKPSYLYQNKIQNINLASKNINEVRIAQNQIFSFWNLVGQPSTQKGYIVGRNIVGNSLNKDVGGGLCQLSGILYHLALQTGLEIIERHNHSIDIYKEDERICPLGADASVVYAYKDLRIRNNTKGYIQFRVVATQEKVTATLLSEKNLELQKIEFNSVHLPNTIQVTTVCNNVKITHSTYKLLEN